jgi:hypothetical protein
MSFAWLIGRERVETPCVIEVENTFESLHAHVKLEGGLTLNPGDEVLVHGAPVEVPFGEKAMFERVATVTRAPWWERAWTRATGDLEFMELCEFSFSERTRL